MPELGIDNLKKIVISLAEILNTGSKVIHGNFLALFELFPKLTAVKDVNFAAAKDEMLNLSVDERKELDLVFVNTLNLVDKEVQKKIAEAANGVEQVVLIVEEGIKVFNDAKVLVDKFKSILSI